MSDLEYYSCSEELPVPVIKPKKMPGQKYLINRTKKTLHTSKRLIHKTRNVKPKRFTGSTRINNIILEYELKLGKAEYEFEQCVASIGDLLADAPWGKVEYSILDKLCLKTLNKCASMICNKRDQITAEFED